MVPRSALVLLTAVCVLLAGCGGVAGPAGTPTDGPDEPPETTTTLPATTEPPPSTNPPSTTTSPSTPNLGEDGYDKSYTFAATAVNGTAVVREVARSRKEVDRAFHWRRQPFLDDLLGSHTAERLVVETGEPDGVPGHLEDGDAIRLNGTFYRLNKTVVDRSAGAAYEVDLEGPLDERYSEDYDRASVEAVAFSSLPRVDRQLFTYAVPPPEERDSGLHSAGYSWVFPAGASRDDSRLVDGDAHYVRYEGGYYRVAAEPRLNRDRYRESGTRNRVRYDLTPVASNASAFAAAHLDEFVTPISNDTPEPPARGVVLEAIENGSVSWEGEDRTPERVHAAEAWVRGRPPEGGHAYVRYDGSLHRIEVRALME